MSTFVAIPADRLLDKLHEIGKKIEERGGRFARQEKRGSEIVIEIALPPSERSRSEFIVLKIYTSIEYGAEEARAVGEDAIRIVVGSISTGEFKVVKPSVTVKRTAPNGVEDRVGAFLERLTDVIREEYRYGRGVPLCACGHHMAQRKGPRAWFWGCTTYPACKGTKKFGMALEKI